GGRGGWGGGGGGCGGGGAGGGGRAFLCGWAWRCGRNRRGLCEPCPPVPGGAAAGDGLGRRVRQGRDRGSAAAVSGGVGRRHAVLRGRVAVVSPLLLRRAPDAR